MYSHISLTPISLHLSPDITLPIAVLSGGASRIHRTNVSDGLRMEGGVNLLVPLLGKAESSEELERAMVLLGSCLYGNAKNIKVGSFSMLLPEACSSSPLVTIGCAVLFRVSCEL